MFRIFGIIFGGMCVSVTTKRCGSSVISMSSTIACLMLMFSLAMMVAICASIPGWLAFFGMISRTSHSISGAMFFR